MTPAAPLPASPALSSAARSDAALSAFTRSGTGPSATFPVVLLSVVVATLAMSLDAVPKYSHDAFFVGVGLTVALAFAAGKILAAMPTAATRAATALFVPAVFGAFIGVVVQTLVLRDVGTSWATAVKDLGGLVDTTEPISWIASGIVLGGLPAIAVSAFLLLAARALRRVTGHDATEGFVVPFTGATGLFAAFALVLVDGFVAPPLFAVAIASALALLVVLLVDGSRARFLRDVYRGGDTGFDVVPAQRFASDPTLAPLVASAGGAAVLVKLDAKLGSYRDAAGQPVALLAATEEETLAPLRRRRLAAASMLVAMVLLSGVAALVHAA